MVAPLTAESLTPYLEIYIYIHTSALGAGTPPDRGPRGVCRGDPGVFLLAECFVGGLGYRGRGTARAPETGCFLASPPSAARPSDRSFLENVWRVGLGTRAGIVCLCRLMPPNPLEMVGGFALHLF